MKSAGAPVFSLLLSINLFPPNFISLCLLSSAINTHNQKHRPHRRLFFPLEAYIRLNTWKSLSTAALIYRQDTVFFPLTSHATLYHSTTQASPTQHIHIPYLPVHTYTYLNHDYRI